MKKVAVFCATFALCFFAAVTAFGLLSESAASDFAYIVYILPPIVSFVTTFLITAEYGKFGLLAAFACVVLQIASSVLTLRGEISHNVAIIAVVAAAVSLAAFLLGLLARRAQNKMRLSYVTFEVALNLVFLGALVAFQYVVTVVGLIAAALGDGRITDSPDFVWFAVASVLCGAVVNFLLNLIPYFSFKKALELKTFNMFLPTVVTAGANLVLYGGFILLVSIE